ncbi:MAG: ABC transporter substrate-binding protein, partial [Myxococcales bacterium]|nr:ABC transporter substrate-binding protein [Myxococcales bacterium]
GPGHTVTLSPVGAVHFPAVPARAVTLDPQYEDLLLAVGRPHALVATGFAGNHDPHVWAQVPGLAGRLDPEALPHIGPGLDKETLYALDAQVHHIDPKRLLRTARWRPADLAEIARNVGPFFANRFSRTHVAPDDEPYTFYDLWTLHETVARVYRRPAPIQALRALHAELVARIEARLPPIAERPRVGLVMHANGRFTPFVRSRPGFGTAHYRAVGARDAVAALCDAAYRDGGRVGPGLDAEGLLALDPDVLIMPFGTYPSMRPRFDALRALAADPVVGRLRAMAHGRVYPGGTPLQGPIVYLFQTEMAAKQIYPHIFGEFRLDGAYPSSERLFDRDRVAQALAGAP